MFSSDCSGFGIVSDPKHSILGISVLKRHETTDSGIDNDNGEVIR